MRTQLKLAWGFTLVELLATLVALALLGAATAPAFGRMLARNEIRAAQGEVAVALAHARHTAVTHNTRVLMCPSDDGQHCLDSNAWQNGWIMVFDADADGQPDAAATPMKVYGALARGMRIVSGQQRTRLAFSPDGSAPASNTSFTICHARVASGLMVVLAYSGRARAADADASHLQQCLAAM